ncbi:MAG TPA: AhpC/TSA family protein [Bacteriovoracaceae bacterium]|nr:AhpC/TSA family protein [Bacteriovoracaceae bacterium]
MGAKVDRTQDRVDILTLNRLKVLDENNKEVLISTFWKEKSVVLIFVRHFSCIACRSHVAQIWNEKEKFKKSKTNIVFIGNGAPQFIQAFKEDMNIVDAPIYTDPSLKTYDACGLHRGMLKLMDPRGAKNMLELAFEGHKQGPLSKDSGSHTQMGGIVALRPPGIVVYHFVSDYLGDNDKMANWENLADSKE